MLKRLRLKFICINMTIVMVMLCIILSLVLHSTQTSLESESLHAMERIAASPDSLIFGKPGEDESVRLPYFLLLMQNNRITIIGGDYFDLSDERMLREILTNAELLQQPELSEQTRTQLTGNILTMSHQMRGLTEELLELARVDNAQSRVTMQELDVSKLISDAALPFEPLFFEHGLSLETQIEPGITLKGCAEQLRQLPEILLDNAQKYSHPNTAVTLTLRRRGYSHCVLAVSNLGDALSQEELQNIFKRFYRADKARAMNHSYGLGLSIAQSICDLHHGTIRAESAGGVNTFTVDLPL